MAGKYFDEWTIGDTLTHEIRRTVTETDNLLFTVMTHNPQPLHLDVEAAKASEFGQILVNGTFTFSLMVGLSVGDTTLGTLVANLGYDKLVMPKPVFIGDTLRATSEVIGLKESKSRPNAGIVTSSTAVSTSAMNLSASASVRRWFNENHKSAFGSSEVENRLPLPCLDFARHDRHS